MDGWHEDQAKFTRLMVRETLTCKEVQWINELDSHGARILPDKKTVIVDGFRKFKLR